MRWRHRLRGVNILCRVDGGEREELTSTVVVGVEQREEGADGEDVVVLGELRHGGGRHCRLQVLSCVERRWSAWSCAGMQKR
jgi:hypothetical protein